MTSKKIKTKDILGKNYYNYNLSSSNYNPSLNSTITITCIVKNVYNNTIPNKSLQLKQNGVNIGNSVSTNSNGVATWTITSLENGLNVFSVDNAQISVYVDGGSLIDDLGDILDDMMESEPLEIIVKYINTQQTISNFSLYNFVTNEYSYTDENDIYHDFTNEAEINYSNNTLSFKLPKELPLEKAMLWVGQWSNMSFTWGETWYFYNLIDEDNDKTITINYYNILKEPPSEE